MLLISLFMLIPMGQAANILHEGTPRLATPDDSAVRSTPVNGTLTSISILEGSGCPAGTYQPGPLEPGKSLNTAVDFDPSIFLYNSTTSLNPVMCTLSIDFEFVYPEDGQADLLILTASSYTTKYEEGDEERGTNFIFKHEMLGMAGDREIEGGIDYISITDGPGEAQVGVALDPEGSVGDVGVGTFRSAISLSTDLGRGELSVSRIVIGFGIYEPPPSQGPLLT